MDGGRKGGLRRKREAAKVFPFVWEEEEDPFVPWDVMLASCWS